MNFRVEYPSEVQKRLDRVDRPTYERIEARMDELAADPFEPRISKALHGVEGVRSSRVGGWRICYTVSRDARVVYILAVERRGQVYRRL